MKPVERSELLGLGEYEQVRERFRARVIDEKRPRRVAVCDEVSAVFENHDTVLFQIQEMVRTERITKEASIAHEIETYNELIPGKGELSATLFVQIDEAKRREEMLVALAGLEERIALQVEGTLVRARNETRGVFTDRTTAVHYVKFQLGDELAEKWRRNAGALSVAFVLDHPKLSVKKELSRVTIAALAEDLA